MSVYGIDPIADCRWHEFLETRSDASAFHTVGWLKSLEATYGYRPLVFTTSAPGGPLTNGIVLCQIKSWLTGTRWVSLPFADHCAPLYEEPNDFYMLLDEIAAESRRAGVDHIEIRPWDVHDLSLAEHTSFRAGERYRLHLLDLRPALDTIFSSFDRSSVQRRLRHATRENLTYEEGTTGDILKKFYHLLVLTRRRHGVPPQPVAWFKNLLRFLGDRAKIRVASLGDTPIASVFTLSHKNSVVYKYGCSDERYHNLGGMVSLFWQAMQDAKSVGAHTFDMGRSDIDNPGLIRFKSNWGTQDLPLTYWRFPQSSSDSLHRWGKAKEIGGNVLSHLPRGFLVAIGNALYRHAG